MAKKRSVRKTTILQASTFAPSVDEAKGDPVRAGDLYEALLAAGGDPGEMAGRGFPMGKVLPDDLSNYYEASLGGGRFCLLAGPRPRVWAVLLAGTAGEVRSWAAKHSVLVDEERNALRISDRSGPDGAGDADVMRRAAPRRKYRRPSFLSTPLTKSAFHRSSDRGEFVNVSRMKLEAWRIFLSEEQRKIVESPKAGAFMVTGSAGTGKTVVGLHRAKFLVTGPDWKKSDRLLFTTYTFNLAEDIRRQLAKLLERDPALAGIEVCSLNSWMEKFIEENGEKRKICYSPDYLGIFRPILDGLPKKVGQKTVTPDFFISEFIRVILTDDVRTREDYLSVDRRGRTMTLGRRQREALWPHFAEMRRLLAATGLLVPQEAFYIARRFAESGGLKKKYRAVIVDELQDFGNDSLRLLRAITEDMTSKAGKQGDLFLLGDDAQRIYGPGQNLVNCGIDVRAKKTRRLRINFRTTAETRASALFVLENSEAKRLDAESRGVPYADDDCRSARSGPLPVVYGGCGPDRDAPEREARWIVKNIAELVREGHCVWSDIAVAVHSRSARDEYAARLAGFGVFRTVRLDRTDPEGEEGVRVATLHRLKGLEFKAVFIADADEGCMPSSTALNAVDDPVVRADTAEKQRAVFYVAMTRARDRVYVSCREKPGEFMAEIARSVRAAA